MEQKEKTSELNYFENPRYVNQPDFFVAEDGFYVCHTETTVTESALSKDFYEIQKFYHKNGVLKSKITYSFQSSIKHEKYDENGYLIQKKEYEPSLTNVLIDSMDYITFFEKEGWYNRSTGQTAFRNEPFPLNTGEFTNEVFRCVDFENEDPSKVIVTIWNIRKIPQRFFDKYGKTREDGSKYLETKIYYPYSKSEKDAIIEPDSRVGGFEVTYCIDVKSGTYKVDWKIVLKIE